mmetsp:Transcript_76059/g.183810  ORF Transcript_76059/g.183810 Transcript_76059/m.183810 type:complete len:267 (+) Transcript_76059:75-875(+)
MSIHQRLAVCQTCLKSASSFTKKLRLGVEPGRNAYNLEECLICSQRAQATRQQLEADAQTQVRQLRQPRRRLFLKDGSPAPGAEDADHDHSLDLNAAVAAVEAPPAEPSGQAGPSGLPAPLVGSPSDIADELGSDFRRGQRVVRALLDETETETGTETGLPAMSDRDGQVLPPVPPTPGAVGSMRHAVGGRDESGRLLKPGSDGSMRSDSSSPPSCPRSLPDAPPPHAPGAGKLAVRRAAPPVDISMLTSGLRSVSLGKRTIDQCA